MSPLGQTTQLIVGATPETDLKILKLSESLYNKLNLKRVYYSAYVSVNNDKNYAAPGSTGYRWLESEMVRELNKQDDIDYSFYDKLVNDAVETISKYGDFEWFVSDDPYISPPFVGGNIKPDFMHISDDSPEEVLFR